MPPSGHLRQPLGVVRGVAQGEARPGGLEGGPVGLSTLAVALGEEPDTIEDVYEPYLLQLGFLQRTPRGRVITDLGRKHVGAVRVDGSLF
mgnify:CR=1 FL=1